MEPNHDMGYFLYFFLFVIILIFIKIIYDQYHVLLKLRKALGETYYKWVLDTPISKEPVEKYIDWALLMLLITLRIKQISRSFFRYLFHTLKNSVNYYD
jgi:hypothetical protein